MGAMRALIRAHPEGESEKSEFEVSKSWPVDTPRIDSNEKTPGREKQEEEKEYVASMKKTP